MFLFEPILGAPAGLRFTVHVVCLMTGTLWAALNYRDKGDDL